MWTGYLFTLICIALPFISFAQDAPKMTACSFPESSQFDFWVGEWELSWQDKDGNTHSGRNIINKILGGCTIEENFSTQDGSFSGKSFSVYNQRKSIWEQTWVDNSGGYMTFTGGIEGDKMMLSREVTDKEGKKIVQRMVFHDIKPDEITWDWESSSDGGITWNLNWRIFYKRK